MEYNLPLDSSYQLKIFNGTADNNKVQQEISRTINEGEELDLNIFTLVSESSDTQIDECNIYKLNPEVEYEFIITNVNTDIDKTPTKILSETINEGNLIEYYFFAYNDPTDIINNPDIPDNPSNPDSSDNFDKINSESLSNINKGISEISGSINTISKSLSLLPEKIDISLTKVSDSITLFNKNLIDVIQKTSDERNNQLQQFENNLIEVIQKTSDERNIQLQQFEDHLTTLLEEKLQLIADMIEGDAKILFKKIANDLYSNFDFEHSSKSPAQVAQETIEKAATFCKKINESLS